MKKTLVAIALALAVLVPCGAVNAANAASEPRAAVTEYGSFDTAGQLSAPSEEPARQFEARLTAAPLDGRVDLSPILQALLGLASTALLGATAVITAAFNKYLNRKSDATRAEMIRVFTERAVAAAANYVKGAGLDSDGKPREVSFPVASEWVERALEQSVALFGGFLGGIGGEDAQRRRIWAQMRLAAGDSVPAMAPVDLKAVQLKTQPAVIEKVTAPAASPA